MEKFLKDELLKKIDDPRYYYFTYEENINNDVLDDTWLDKRTSYIYKVAVMTAIDKNKCDFAHIVIGVQRGQFPSQELKGYFYFKQGENDDMGRVIERAVKLLKDIHPAFDNY